MSIGYFLSPENNWMANFPLYQLTGTQRMGFCLWGTVGLRKTALVFMSGIFQDTDLIYLFLKLKCGWVQVSQDRKCAIDNC